MGFLTKTDIAMSTPLIENAAGFIATAGTPPNVGPHCIDAFLSAGKLYMKITLDGRNPGGGVREVCLHLSHQQAQELVDGLTRGLLSL